MRLELSIRSHFGSRKTAQFSLRVLQHLGVAPHQAAAAAPCTPALHPSSAHHDEHTMPLWCKLSLRSSMNRSVAKIEDKSINTEGNWKGWEDHRLIRIEPENQRGACYRNCKGVQGGEPEAYLADLPQYPSCNEVTSRSILPGRFLSFTAKIKENKKDKYRDRSSHVDIDMKAQTTPHPSNRSQLSHPPWRNQCCR